MNVELGLWSPVPWYYSYFQAADRLNCSPRDLIEDYTPAEFWFEAAIIVLNAENDHQAYASGQQERAQAKQQAGQQSMLRRALTNVRKR